MGRTGVVILFLLLAVSFVYQGTARSGFIQFDDDRYVYQNPHVLRGISFEGAAWAFQTTKASNWHPLTWLSHMLDVQLWGVGPLGPHVTNVFFHGVNVVLLFLLWLRMTGAFWPSAWIAAVFALHPLHVESVAWISERKDVLSTFFWWLSIWFWTDYARKPSRTPYLAALVCAALGLMSKSMVMTLPFTLLLLDFWPLRRLRLDGGDLQKRITEKLPFFVLSLAAGVIAILTQRHGAALMNTEIFPISVRVANAVTSYGVYIEKLFWPFPLAAYYPHPVEVRLLPTALGTILIGGVSYLAWRFRRSRPWLAFGWCWYLGTLVPVIGLVQVGTQAMADRYTYVPLVGLFVIMAWGAPELFRAMFRKSSPAPGLAIVAALFLAPISLVAVRQVSRWNDTETLFRHTLAVTQNNPMALGILGTALSQRGAYDEAIENFRASLRLKPDLVQSHNNLGIALYHKGQYDAAIRQFREVLRISPDHDSSRNNLGSTLYSAGRYKEAIHVLTTLEKHWPESADVHNNLANALDAVGRTDEAILHYKKALRLRPDDASTHNNLGVTLTRIGKGVEAVSHFRRAIALRPAFVRAHRNLGLALLREGQPDKAAREFRTVLSLAPDDTQARTMLDRIDPGSP